MKEHPRTRTHGELIEMADHRLYWSDDGWQTIWARSKDGKRWRKVPAQLCDLVRFLAVSQSSWTGNAG